MLLKNKQIAIVGGGPGGLTLARLLQLQGANVKVYERDFGKETRVQGATLDLHEESGLEAIRRAGLIEEFYANYRPSAGLLRISDKNLAIYLDDHANLNGYTEERPEIDRGSLRKILLESLATNTVVWDSNFLSMQKQEEGWLLHFKNNTSAYADIIVAADGANSKIRPYLSEIRPIYSGITIVEGNIHEAELNAPKLYALVKGGKVFAFGDEQSIILSAKGDGSLSFYTGCKVSEDWIDKSGIDFNDKDQVFDWFKEAFSAWAEDWHELFSSNDLWCIPRPQYHFPINQNWITIPSLTMLGDAAHRMPPYAGEGVNMAMQDAFELADCLTNDKFPTLETAINYFENQMRARTAEITQATLENTEMLHSNKAIEIMLAMIGGQPQK